MKKQVGVGVIGLAGPGASESLLGIQDREGSRLRVVAVCDPNTSSAQHAAARHKIPFVTSDYMDLVTLPGVDVVAVFSPTAEHFDQCMSALMSGKHVLCLGPLAESADRAAALAKEADTRGVRLRVGHTGAGNPEIASAIALCASGDLGDITAIECTLWSQSSDILALSHPVHLIHSIAGEITEVYAVAADLSPPGATTVSVLRFANGIAGRITAVLGRTACPIPAVSLSVWGSRGSLVGDRVVLDSVAGRPAMTFAAGQAEDSANEAADWLCALEAEIDGRGSPDHWSAVRTAAVCDAVWRSTKSGNPEKVVDPAP